MITRNEQNINHQFTSTGELGFVTSTEIINDSIIVIEKKTKTV